MSPVETKRNYRVIGLVEDGDTYAVQIRKADGTLGLCGSPREFGLWGLTPKERKIIRRGLTASGHDRKPNGRAR